MSAEWESADQPKPRTCSRCGDSMPPQKAGRPRKWCSQQCRQSAYEERHGLESWTDRQPTVDDISDVVEVMADRASRRTGARRRALSDRHQPHTPDDCLNVVGQDLVLMATIVEQVIDITRRFGVISSFEGRLLGERVPDLVNIVLDNLMRVVPADECPRISPSTPED